MREQLKSNSVGLGTMQNSIHSSLNSSRNGSRTTSRNGSRNSSRNGSRDNSGSNTPMIFEWGVSADLEHIPLPATTSTGAAAFRGGEFVSPVTTSASSAGQHLRSVSALPLNTTTLGTGVASNASAVLHARQESRRQLTVRV